MARQIGSFGKDLNSSIPEGVVTDAKALEIPGHEHKWEPIDAHYEECFSCKTMLFFNPLTGTDTVCKMSQAWWEKKRTHDEYGLRVE